MSKIIRFIFILSTCLMLSVQVYSQQSRSSAATKKNEQVKEENKKAYQKSRRKTIRHRREIQTSETKKRMDAADKRAQAYNRQNDKKWYQKIFKKKHSKR